MKEGQADQSDLGRSAEHYSAHAALRDLCFRRAGTDIIDDDEPKRK